MPKVAAAASSVCGVNGRGKTWRAAAPGAEAPSLPPRFPLPQRLLLLLPRPVPPPAAARVGSLRRQGRRGRRRDRLLRPRSRLSGRRRSPRVRVQRVLLRRRLLPAAAQLPRGRRQVRRPFPILRSEDPLFLEPYWQQHASTSSIVLPGWQCMSSQTMGGDFISAELDRHVRLLHKAAENAITDGKFILFGSEVGELLHALVHALSADNASSSSACLVASAPHNPFGRRQHECIGIRSNYVKGSVSPATKIIEYVTSPNDPDGLLQQSVLGASAVIHDHAYFWPHYSSIPAPAEEDIMLFTISKISGHAGIRLWWAVIKDQKTYQKAAEYMSLNTMVVSCDVQLRVLKLIRVVIAEMGKGGGIFEFGYKTLKTRWSKLHKLISSSNRFSIQPLLPRYCNYFKKIRDPSPAYAWLKCEMEEDEDCYAVLKKSGITSRSGTLFEANSHYTRLSLVQTEDDFDLLTMRMEALVSKELIASS